MFFDRRFLHQFDWGLLALTFFIPICGLTVLYSAGYAPEAAPVFSWVPGFIQSPAFVRQVLFLCFGVMALLVGLSISSPLLYRISYVLYALGIVLLLVTLIIGVVSHGSQRWLNLGIIRFQVSEFMKIALVIALSRFLSKNPPAIGGYRFAQLIVPFLFFGVPMLLVMRQPDLGTGLVIGAIGFLMVLFMGIRPRSIGFMAGALVMLLIPAWHMLRAYQKRRILALLNPGADPLGSGYHIIQSKIAVGSGLFFGKGFMEGTQTQLEFLPEHTTDFVFSVLGEEWGFLGSFLVLLMYYFLISRMLRVAWRTKDLFPSLLVFGMAVMIFIHVVVNVGMVLGFLPVVGLPLPLFSYGGSSLLTTMFAIGLVLGVSMRKGVVSSMVRR